MANVLFFKLSGFLIAPSVDGQLMRLASQSKASLKLNTTLFGTTCGGDQYLTFSNMKTQDHDPIMIVSEMYETIV